MDTMSDGENSSGDASKNVGELVSPMKSQQPHRQTAQVQITKMPPQFLNKTYDMVDDPLTDSIVSWSSTNNSFVIWKMTAFARDLLPKYFKHNNFSSFVRQLSAYGFKKVGEVQWEFANEGFLKGQKHLLLTITRKKQVRQHGQQLLQQSQQQQGSCACVEVGKFGLKEDVEQLKRDKNVLMQDLVRLRQQQQATDGHVQDVLQHLQGMEQRQQQIVSFVNAVQIPGYLDQFLQQQKESRITDANIKRSFRHQSITENDGQIVNYQPLINEVAKEVIRQIMEMDVSSYPEPSRSDHDKRLIGDGSLSAGTVDCRSNLSLHDLMQTSAVISEILFSQDANKVATPKFPDTMPVDLESIVDMTSVKCMEADKGSNVFADLNADLDLDAFLDDPLWYDLVQFLELEDSEIVQVGIENSETAQVGIEDSETAHVDGENTENKENGSDTAQHIKNLVEQMDLLASDTDKV